MPTFQEALVSQANNDDLSLPFMINVDQLDQLCEAVKTNLVWRSIRVTVGSPVWSNKETRSKIDEVDHWFEKIAKALRTNKHITSVAINSRVFTNKGVKAIAKMLENNPRITVFKLLGIETEPNDIDLVNLIHEEALKALADVFKNNNTLVEFHLNLYTKGPRQRWSQGWRAIAAALKSNKALKSFELYSCSLADDEVVFFADMLKYNNVLECFSVAYNQVGDKSARAFADALKVNMTLLDLNLMSDGVSLIHVTEVGAAELGGMLTVNRCLQVLNLEGHKIRDKGAIALAAGLKKNKSLGTLNLLNNAIHTLGVEAMLEALESNVVMYEIALRGEGDDAAATLGSAGDEEYLKFVALCKQLDCRLEGDRAKMVEPVGVVKGSTTKKRKFEALSDVGDSPQGQPRGPSGGGSRFFGERQAEGASSANLFGPGASSS